MAVELEKLYKEIYLKYNVRLKTSSCFKKRISWLHILENIEFAPFLHGDELVFNASLNYANDAERKYYIDQLLSVDAGGLIVSLQDENPLSPSLVEYCNNKQFPLFITDWETPFINITRIFSEILIDNERTEMDMIAAFKNALFYPHDSSLYLPQFEAHQFPADSFYTVSIIGSAEQPSNYTEENIKRIEKTLQSEIKQCVFYREEQKLIVLSCGPSIKQTQKVYEQLVLKYPSFHFGIGSRESHISNISRSYNNAKTTFHLCGSIIQKNPLNYQDLGVYQILADMKDPKTICPPFIQETLGKLIEYDNTHNTKYMEVLNDFFDNDCSITQTANATFYHQNTLKYKVKNIKEILGYDITSNENRVRIMLALYIIRIADNEELDIL